MNPETKYLESEWQRVLDYLPDSRDREVLDRYVHYRIQRSDRSRERWDAALYVAIVTIIVVAVIGFVLYLGVTIRRTSIEAPLQAEIKFLEKEKQRISERCIDKIVCDCIDAETPK